MAIQSVVANHLWLLISLTPFLRFPKRLVRSTCRRFLSRSFRSELKWDGKRTWRWAGENELIIMSSLLINGGAASSRRYERPG